MPKKPYIAPRVTKYPGIGKFCRARILAGDDNLTILAKARRKFPDSKVSYKSVAFYVSDLRRNGIEVPDRRKAA